MVRGPLIAALVLFVGHELAERVRVKQEELILRKLSEADAAAYYEVLRKRARRTRLLRGVVLIALVVGISAGRRIQRQLERPPAAAPAGMEGGAR